MLFFLTTDLVVAFQNFVKTLPVLIWRLVELFAYLFNHTQIFLALGFIVLLCSLDRLLVWHANLFAMLFGLFKSLMGFFVFHDHGSLISARKRGSSILKFQIDQALLVKSALFIQGLNQRAALPSVLLPAVEGFVETVACLFKLAKVFRLIAIGPIENGSLHRFFGAKITIGNWAGIV